MLIMIKWRCSLDDDEDTSFVIQYQLTMMKHDILFDFSSHFVEGYYHMEICTVKIHLKMTSNNVNCFDIGNLKCGIYNIGIEICDVKSIPGI